MTKRDRCIVLKLVLGAFFTACPSVVAAAQPTEAAQPTQPAQPTEAAQPAQPAPPTQPSQPAPSESVVQHIAAAEVSTTNGSLAFDVTNPHLLGSLVVRWRRPHARAAIHEIPVRRLGERWEADLPPGALRPPGIEYWVVERPRAGTGAERAIFASERRPRFLGVWAPDAEAHEQEALALRGGRRSSLSARGEYVEFGRRRLGSACSTGAEGGCSRWPDRYWHLEASYAYSFFTHVEQIRLSVGTVRGSAANDQDAYAYEAGAGYDAEIGIQYGRAEITWYLVDFVRARTSVLLGFSTEGFEIGAGAELILGNDLSTNIALGVEGTSTLGATGRLRLEWWTLPRLPMGASVEITTFPTGSDAGVRLLYDVAYVLYPGALLRVRGGYQGRTSVTGGPALGGEAVFAF